MVEKINYSLTFFQASVDEIIANELPLSQLTEIILLSFSNGSTLISVTLPIEPIGTEVSPSMWRSMILSPIDNSGLSGLIFLFITINISHIFI